MLPPRLSHRLSQFIQVRAVIFVNYLSLQNSAGRALFLRGLADGADPRRPARAPPGPGPGRRQGEQMLETYEQFTDEIRGRKHYSTPTKKPLAQGSAHLADSTNLPKTPVKT